MLLVRWWCTPEWRSKIHQSVSKRCSWHFHSKPCLLLQKDAADTSISPLPGTIVLEKWLHFPTSNGFNGMVVILDVNHPKWHSSLFLFAEEHLKKSTNIPTISSWTLFPDLQKTHHCLGLPVAEACLFWQVSLPWDDGGWTVKIPSLCCWGKKVWNNLFQKDFET